MTMTTSVSLCFMLFVLQEAETANTLKAPVVKTSMGEIIGTSKEVSVFGKKISVHRFFGIPYAEAPVGELRFQKPVPKKPFTSPFQATEHGKACLHLLAMPMSDAKEKAIPTGEDCLSLNVYVPAENSGSKAVMVWIHGGGFFWGASNIYIADTLAAHGDVIVITINYRLSIWGFLSTGDEHAPGNYGLWDQHLAIKWVHDNIERFGGDTTRVTIFGESAGAGSGVYQGLFEGNKGLFQRVIAHSGSVTSKWATCRSPKKDAEKLGKLVGCDGTDSKTLIDCLRSQTPELLHATLNDFTNGLISGMTIPFLPTVDGEFVQEIPTDLLLSDSYISAEGRKFFGTLDFMSSINALEGLGAIGPGAGIADPESFKPNRTYFEKVLIPMALHYGIDNGDLIPEIIKDLVIHEYTDWSDPSDVQKRVEKYVALFSDLSFSCSLVETVARHRSLADSTKRTYMYFFDILPSVRFFQVPSWATRSNHGDDLIYTFFEEHDGVMTYLKGHEDFRPNDWDREHAKYIMTMLSNFAKTGNPNKPTPVKMFWPEYTEERQEYLHLTAEMTSDSVKRHLLAKEFSFWRKVIPKVYEALKRF